MPRDIKVELGDNVLQRGCVLKDDVVMGRLYGNSMRKTQHLVIMGAAGGQHWCGRAARLT